MHPAPTSARANHLRGLVDALLDSAKRAEAERIDSAEIAAFLTRGLAQAAAADDTMKTAATLTPLLPGEQPRTVSAYPAEPTPALTQVLSMMLWQTGPIAHAYRAAGHAIPRKAEAEQAFVLHKLIGLALVHGDRWQAEASAELTRITQAAATTPTDAEIEALMGDDEDAAPSPLQEVTATMERNRRYRLLL